MPTTTFIALQCCQCSTMQVKQQKKSSNKWNCVVCNLKQSVRKVFAQSFIAKDVRKFVQNFNMNRQISQLSFAENDDEYQALALPPSDDDQEIRSRHNKKKRTDWTEYIKPEEDEFDPNFVKEEEIGADDEFEPKIVTELPPRAVFKRPQLKTYSATTLDCGDAENRFRPVFPKRSANFQLQENKATIYGEAMAGGIPKWNDPVTEAGKVQEAKEPTTCTSIKKSASKWADYITHDDDGDYSFSDTAQQQRGPTTVKETSSWSSCITTADEGEGQWNLAATFDGTMNDQIVEEDIHPEFQ